MIFFYFISYRNSLQFKFENIAEAIKLKGHEMDSIIKDFEFKLKQKEVCHHNLVCTKIGRWLAPTYILT